MFQIQGMTLHCYFRWELHQINLIAFDTAMFSRPQSLIDWTDICKFQTGSSYYVQDNLSVQPEYFLWCVSGQFCLYLDSVTHHEYQMEWRYKMDQGFLFFPLWYKCLSGSIIRCHPKHLYGKVSNKFRKHTFYLAFFVYEWESAHYRYYKALDVYFDIFCLTPIHRKESNVVSFRFRKWYKRMQQ